MKFLSDILAKAGLTVDGVVTFNNTATGQTPATNDNSTKLATTAFIKNQSYLTANQTITVSGDATGSGTTSIALTLANSGVTAGTYGNASNIPTITVDAKGRITSISTTAVSIVTTLAGLSDVTLTSPSANQVLQYNGTQWVNGAAPTTYTLPIATSSVLGGIKVGTGLTIDAGTGVLSTSGGGGSITFKSIQEFTATAAQTTFTIIGGYTAGNIDVFVNGVYLSTSQYTATNLTTVVLADASSLNDVVTVFLYGLYSGTSSYARNVDTLTATAGQTSFTTSYIPGQIDVFYNGSKLSSSEFTATSGSSVILTQAAAVGDILEVVTYLAGAGLNASRTLTINGTTYDLTANRTWTLTTANISEVTNLYYTDARVATYLTTNSYATQTYVTTAISNLVASSPATLDTLNELALALGNDANFATTVATSIGTKQAQLNGTGFVKVTGTTVSYDNSTYLTTGTASSTYLPYTGANADLVLGANNFSSKRVSVLKSSDGYGGFTSNYLFLQTGSSTTNVGTDGISLFSKPNQRALSINYDISGTNYAATLDANLLTASRTFEFPNTSGILALTSNLSSYLPLTGGTLTGPLIGTSSAFSTSVLVGTGTVVEPLTVSYAAHGLISQHRQSNSVGVGQNFYMKFNDASGTAVNYAGVYADIQVNTTGAHNGRMILQVANAGSLLSAVTIANTGVVTFSSSLTATYGYFSGTGFTSFNSQLTVNNTTSSPALITFQNTLNGHAFGFNSSGTQRFTFINGGLNEILSVTSAGVVTAEQQFRTKIGYQFYADSTAQGGIYPYKIWSGTGTDTTPTFAAEGNLGVYFCVNGTVDKVLRLASTGHLLVGSTSTDQSFWPSWDGGVIRIGQGGTIFHYRDSATDFMIGGNYYISSSGAQETRIATGGASNIYLENGNIRFRNAISGAAGSSISWNTSLFLQTNGFVGVSTQTQWNYEKFGVGMSQSNTWGNVTAIMRLTNYISGGVTKITFTDSSIIDGWFGMVPVSNGSYFVMGFSGQTEQGFKLYQNGTSYFANTVTVNGSILPNSDAAYNLGSTSYRWANVYTTDLHLSNEGKQNIVDGTWGDWTLQEGENDIFMLNNRSGEKFKIKLEKV